MNRGLVSSAAVDLVLAASDLNDFVCDFLFLLLRDVGEVYTDRFDAPRTHPMVAVRRDSRLAFLRALRELDLTTSSAPGGNARGNGYPMNAAK